MNGLEILNYDGKGYFSHFSFEEWKIAYLNHAPMFTPEGITYLEKHNKTDEVFILLEGSATLLMGENAEEVKMEKFVTYVVKKAAWHNIIVSEDAKVLIVENKDTGKHNSEYLPFRYNK